MKRLLLAASVTLALVSAAFSQSVTVGGAGSGADYPNLTSALEATSASLTTPDVITFIDEGPFIEPARIIVNQNYALDEFGAGTPLTIKATPGLRPRVVVEGGGPSAMYFRKVGELILRDFIVMPATTVAPATHGIVIDDHDRSGNAGETTSVTVENIMVTSNDGTNQPVASLDGLTSPTYTANTVSFVQDGISVSSMEDSVLQTVHMFDVVVSGIPGDPTNGSPSCGIRGFMDGAPGSEWLIGPGCVVSYCNTSDVRQATPADIAWGAFQPGGNLGGIQVKVLGTQDKPVLLINNNLNGIAITNAAATTDGLQDVEWCIVANNLGAGYTTGDTNSPTDFTNVTFANNDHGVIYGPTSADLVQFNLSNVIAAGNGNATDTDNVIRLLVTGLVGFGSTFTANDSAIVLNGPYTLNNVDFGGDGIDSDVNWTVVKNNVTALDPQFVSLDPTNGGFAVVANQAYATAGPSGQPLVGGGSFAASSVEDWQLF